jgi:hypothetical protein
MMRLKLQLAFVSLVAASILEHFDE